MEPLWMADDASCLLKAGVGKYLLWSPNCRSEKIVNENYLAHRLTYNGTVVGTLTLPVTFVKGSVLYFVHFLVKC